MSGPQVTDEAIRDWWARHPEVMPGFDVAPLVGLELARLARPSAPEAIAQEALASVLGRSGSVPRRELVTELVSTIDRLIARDRAIAAHRGVPGRPGRHPDTADDWAADLASALAKARAQVSGDHWPTQAAIAEKMGIEDRTLRKMLARWPELRAIVTRPTKENRP